MTDRLFKFGSLEDEIMKSMETSLVKNQHNKIFGHEKLAKAVDHLNAAAEIFDDTGFSKAAEAVTRLIEKLADEKANLGGLIEESLSEKDESPINKLIEEELNKKEVEDLIESREPYKSEYDEMVGGLHEDPLADLKASLSGKKKL